MLEETKVEMFKLENKKEMIVIRMASRRNDEITCFCSLCNYVS